MIQSKALEENLASYRVDVRINSEYEILQDIMQNYYGLTEGLNTFLKELSHPYRNWQFIVMEARGYSLDYFHLLKNHEKGPEGARIYTDIFIKAIESTSDKEVQADAADNLLLFHQKMIKASGSQIERFLPVLFESFLRIAVCKEAHFFLFLKSYYQVKRLVASLLSACRNADVDFSALNQFLLKYYRETYRYWQSEADPQEWFESELELTGRQEALDDTFKAVSYEFIGDQKNHLRKITAATSPAKREFSESLLQLPGYHHFVEAYRHIPRQLFQAGKPDDQGNKWKLIFIFHIMNIAGLSMIHEEALRDINRTLNWLIANEEARIVRQLVEQTFSILKKRTRRFPATALNCIVNMGKAVYETDEIDLINEFIDSVIDLGFQTPMIGGVGNDWQIRVNSAHIQNIRTWLEIIELNPKWSTRLLSALIVYLSISGVFIKDTDLFPRDITQLLNSDIGPVYNLIKQLARLIPTFFNEIGAEGELREISTEIDELTHRKDALVHFLRKQSHVESSNRIIHFMQATLDFWRTRDKNGLRPFVPPSLFDRIDTRGEFIDGLHRLVAHLDTKGILLPEALFGLSEKRLVKLLAEVTDVSEKDRRRLKLAIEFYKLLSQKYDLNFIEMDRYLNQLKAEAFPDIARLKKALNAIHLKDKISGLLGFLERLQTLILSSDQYEIREDIYKKRHFAIDIPSMYGSYREPKFDALGLTFRLESIINVLFEQMVANIDLSLITKATFFEVYDYLKLFNKALNLDGISSVEIERQLDFLAHSLEVRGFTFTQYLDIFKGFAQAVKNIVNDYFNNIHEGNLDRILSRIGTDQILSKYLPRDHEVDPEKLKHRVSEIFFRERIAMSLGLQQMDLFLSRILKTLYQQSSKLKRDDLQKLLLFDHQSAISPIDQKKGDVSDIIHLGNKGHNMVKLKQLGLPVPPGFIITTEVFRSRKILDRYPPAEQNIKEQIQHHIGRLEKMTGLNFGDPQNPLLFSVRSGSAISQPGMMDTFLNVGINEKITSGIAARTGNAWFAWDNYRRFLQCYGMSFGLERDDFDAIISHYKLKWGIAYKRSFGDEQMKVVAHGYRKRIEAAGVDILENPFDQLYLIVQKVFDSWESAKAKTYRHIMGISDDWGTAVTVQAMVFGNLSEKSGTGVIFTHNPRWSGDSLHLWGDFTLENQGEDVVSGLVNTLPISLFQQDIEKRNTDVTLETHFPDIYNALKRWAYFLIYDEGWSPQEMEFTFEKPTADGLYMLQTRDMTIRERKKVLTFELEDASGDKLLSHGIGVSGGAMIGRIVFSLKEIDAWREKEPGTHLILCRNDTVPDDIREIFAADGLLTARGGLTSHAAVVAHRLGKTCVVGCGNLTCQEKEQSCLFNGEALVSGDFISIDGQQGAVYRGLLRLKETT